MYKTNRYFWISLLAVTLCVFSVFQGQAQQRLGFIMPEGVKKVEIPFEEYSNLIVIPITVNQFFTLKFILDTGAESAILTEKIFGDMLGLEYVRDITIQGPGMVDSLSAYVASSVHLTLPGGIEGYGLNMLVLKEDYLELNRNLGEEIYGIIGYDVFKRFVVNIDYDDDVITLYDPKHFKARRQFEPMSLEIHRTKPFLNMAISQRGKVDSVKLMVDTGASHAILLDVKQTNQIVLPDKLISARLGQGLGGEIPGFLGRINNCYVSDDFEFDDVLVSIPLDGAYIKAIKRGTRHGTIGGDLLSRFNVTFDYPNNMIYLRKGRHYRDTFEFDMSGLTLTAEGKNLDSLVVAKVRTNTPAYFAGIQAGDYIVKINGMTLVNASMSQINALLRKKAGLKIRVVLIRDGEKLKKIFYLRRMI